MFISAQDAHFYSDIMLGSFNDFKEIVIGEILYAVSLGNHYTRIEIPEETDKEECNTVKEDLLFLGYKIEWDEFEWIVSWW